jgi:hypothetical protein
VNRALLLAIAAALAAAAPAAADSEFATPSKNIVCAYFAKQVRCDIHSLNDVAYVVGSKGKGRRIHITDAVGPGKVLGYGRTKRMGPGFLCHVSKAGVRCRNTRTNHGFFVARERQRVF